jgi:ABC-2 type transport system ATP-binding protein
VVLDGQKILKGISADIPAGKIVGLLGPSGAGKTTLIRAIVGRQRISLGKISVLEKPAGSAALRGSIGYMTQAASVYPDLTVRENVQYFATMLGLGRNEVDDVIAKVDLTPQTRQLVKTLSGGQKSRVSLAIALLGSPDMLVLDEPTVGVDPVLRQQLWRLFAELAASGTSIIVSSHVMDEASRCDELLLIREGKLLAQGSPRELCERTGTKTVEESFLKLVGVVK